MNNKDERCHRQNSRVKKMEQRCDLVGEVGNTKPSVIIIPCVSMILNSFEQIMHMGAFICIIPFY